MLVDIEGSMAAGNLAALWRTGDAPVVEGRFCRRRASFMWMVHQLVEEPAGGPAGNGEEAVVRVTGTGPALLHRQPVAAFLAQLQLPSGTRLGQSGDGPDSRIRLWAPDGSAVEVSDQPAADGHHHVVETGPDQMRRQVEDAAARWMTLDSPGWERFGITAAPDRQHVWFDHPGSPHTWPLDLAGEP